MEEIEKVEFTSDQIIQLLTSTLSLVLNWMPAENISKAILVPDPRDSSNLIAVHNGPDGLTLLIDEGYDEFIDEILCEDCQEQLEPFSVVYTGINNETGEPDEDAPVGLYGAHDEDEDIGENPIEDVPELIQSENLSKKRTLN